MRTKIFTNGIGCVGVDAPNIDEALAYVRKYFDEREDTMKMFREQQYTVLVNGNKTTVIRPDGKTATAKCHPDDEFDVVEGFRVALDKIEERTRKLTTKEKELLQALVTLDCESIYKNDDNELGCCFADETIYKDIDENDFKWFELYEDYYPKELLEKYS